MIRLFAALFAALLMAGCASSLPPAPLKAATPDYKYLIGAGDSLNISVWRNPELSATVPVRPDGKITAPLVEDMVAIGKNPTELAREMEAKLKKYIQDPVVTIVVQGFVGPTSEQVRIVGQAARPAALNYKQDMTVLDAMISVGGITEFAAGNRAVLIRATEANKAYNIRLHDLLKRGDVTANVELRPGDVIIIPESWF
ncbi:XrtA/PEP-CTERM system exopolysaccharide export protein [Quisquiliibacterium transsilvanicum]|jgi:polysaccharide export outer membrane protein|uniref:Polysaccharide export outer membrane protein n=1 Tax=Quisquiliibacterium transsilvanicum TaxID=1549638 RepID=A0A7W8HDR9_9BURK|nr:XrtA/PEP-CTERM system exopolysaccharide export protein [Quisquiliibacterium transsilvanicum]MBB5270048.1 polysaccharide export outer membrane protein [Quisquiliibacterium transsilvanicum]